MAPAISRMHSRLEYRQGAYYLKDLNSRNGTFVNGERLMPQEARIVSHGDRVAFADVRSSGCKDVSLTKRLHSRFAVCQSKSDCGRLAFTRNQ